MLFRFRVSMPPSASSLMCLAAFFWDFGAGGSTTLVGRDEASETGYRSLKVVVGGAGKVISASLDAVRRRRCNVKSRDESGLMFSDPAPPTLCSKAGISSRSLLISLSATLTLTFCSVQWLGVLGDGKGDGWSVVVGDIVPTAGIGDEGGEGARGEYFEDGKK